MPDSDPPRKRLISGDDLRLWKYITRKDKRYGHADYPEASPESSRTPSQPVSMGSHKDYEVPPPPVYPRKESTHAIRIGDSSAVDKKVAQRLKRGKYPVDKLIDLHGYNRLDAQSLVRQAIFSACERHQRCLLVITGKGKRQDGEDGVLKRELPHWLNQPDVRPHILACVSAPDHLGGQGAYYILLKRQRKRL